MAQIRPITGLGNTAEIFWLHARRKPLFIAKNGYGDFVVMSIETHEAMIEAARTYAAISEAEQEYAADGAVFNAKENRKDNLKRAVFSLKRKGNLLPAWFNP